MTLSGDDQRRIAQDTIRLIDMLIEVNKNEHAIAERNLERWQHWREVAETLNRDLNRVSEQVDELKELLERLEKGSEE